MKALAVSILTAVGGFLIYRSGIFDYKSDETNLETTKTLSLLRINLADLERNFKQTALDLVTGFESIGFASVYGIEGFDEDELLKWTKWFFELPIQSRMAISKKAFKSTSPVIFRGYTPIVPGTHSYKEAFEMGIFNQDRIVRGVPKAEDIRNTTTTEDKRPFMRNVFQEKNAFPESENETKDVEFAKVMKKYFRIYKKVGDSIMRLLLAGSGLNEHSQFSHMFGEQMVSTLRLLHYPSRLDNKTSIPDNAWDGETAIVTGAHHDTSIVTILSTFNASGLQIKPPGYSDWMTIPVEKNALVINIGSLLASLFDDKIIATNHRVIDIGTDRFSVPFFYECNFDADVSRTFYGSENVFVGRFDKYGPWCANRTSQFYEYATTDFGVVD